jgi:hypothetical protein
LAAPGIVGDYSSANFETTQEWDASNDLSIPPASNKKQLVCRIWVDKGSTITSSLLDYNTKAWSAQTNLNLEIDRSSANGMVNVPVASRSYNRDQRKQVLKYKVPINGKPSFYSVYVEGSYLPETKDNWWFNLQNSYRAPMKD